MENIELDFLENNIIKTLTYCSRYTFNEIKPIFFKTKSFDTTIEILKYAEKHTIPLEKALNVVFVYPQLIK